MKKVFLIFLLSFILNVVWENLHSFFYVGYMGGTITEFILLRASLFDALVITGIALPFLFLPFLKNKQWLILIIGTGIAVFNEWYGLGTGRWVYNSLMPIVPFFEVGLTPMLQLGVLGYLTILIQDTFFFVCNVLTALLFLDTESRMYIFYVGCLG